MRRRTFVWSFAVVVLASQNLVVGVEPELLPGLQPRVGQPGKDIVWVPTPPEVVTAMLDLAKVTAEDYVVDLGSGDGVIVIGAARRGSRAHGVEFDPELVEVSRRNATRAGVGDRATFEQADMFEADFSRATVVTLFLIPSLNIRLRPTLLELAPGTRIVSNSYDMGDWQPDETTVVPECATAELKDGAFVWRACAALMWIVPPKIGGTWRLPQGELRMQQEFQMVSGSLDTGDQVIPISNGRLLGNSFNLSIGDADYHCRVSGDVMDGTVVSKSGSAGFVAVRVKDQNPSHK